MPTVQILVAGVDVTADVVYASARFLQKVNGQPGDGYMRVRDDDSTYSFTAGSDWLVLVDGSAAWRGFVMTVRRVYIAPAMNVAESGLQRFIDLSGPDGNILFDRRVVASASSPATVEGTQFPADTADTTAITNLLANWLDLSADSIDTSSGVTHVGNLDPAQVTRAWSGGWTWQQAMDTIAMLPGAIYSLRPEAGTPHYTLVYCDVDTPTSPFGLSDTPDGVTTLGYREMEITLDGTGLVTDELAWGFGYGSQTPVFSRATDAPTLDAHGRWQDGRQASGVYKQATIDRIAQSVVYGSPTNHRGAKDDRVSVSLVTYHPGLLAGHVVDFGSNVFSYFDTVPVRQSELTFDAPDAPKWRLTLSQDIDSPWGFFDQFWPRLPGYAFPTPRVPGVPVLPGGCNCVQSVHVYDSFDRPNGPIGIADSGQPWYPGTDAVVLSDHFASLGGDFSTYSEYLYADLGPSVAMTFTIVDLGGGGQANTDFTLDVTVSGTSRIGWHVSVLVSGNATSVSEIAAYLYDESNTVVTSATTGTVVAAVGASSITIAPGSIDIVVATTSLSLPMPSGTVITDARNMRWWGQSSSTPVVLDSLDITGSAANVCNAVQFDDFSRVVPANGWGFATPSGVSWGFETPSGSGYELVNGAQGILYCDGSTYLSTAGCFTQSYAAAPWNKTDGWVMTARVMATTTSIANAALFFTLHISSTETMDIKLNGFGGDIEDQDGNTAAFTWTSGVWLTVRWGITWNADAASKTWHAKVWPDSATEPGWMISGSGGTAYIDPANTYLIVDAQSYSSTPATYAIDSIDFDYSGKPCYYDCAAPTAVDTFERTDPSSLGTATPAGVAWTYFGTGIVAYSVDGHNGVRTYGSDLTNVAGTGARLTLPTAYAEGVEMYAEFTATGEPTSGALSWGESIAFGSGSAWDVIQVSAVPVGFATTWAVTAQNGPGTTTFRTAAAGTASSWWSIRVQRLSDRVRVKAWLRDSESEPYWQAEVMRTSTVDPSTAVIDWGGHGSYNPSPYATASLAILSAGSALCVPVASSPTGLPTSPGGFGCEAPTASSSTVYATSSQFAAGSVMAWVGGVLQRPGVDYTEDAGLTSITFTTAPSGSVRVCYLAVAP